MYIIKLDAINSTNSYLREMCAANVPKDFTVVVTKDQTEGRGQMGTVWHSEKSKNLMFSVFKDVSFLNVNRQFYISMAVSMGVYTALKKMLIPNLSIKWPNDILSDNKKVAGILIENIIKSNRLTGTIVGVGINVNQLNFENLPDATSLKLLTGQTLNLDELLVNVLNSLQVSFHQLEHGELKDLKARYESLLFGKERLLRFVVNDDTEILGTVKGISGSGKLKVEHDGKVISYDLKEIAVKHS
ncbi:MAG: biotin--[acetyl-CoA-carboxylase] ligase [Winogradskyella sp.]|nr:biotin--[acetyl-CoA-carboxylase] ligase [Winogradskyella sp.]NNF85207.1 biotin--[acetyl-CoA-carboxylase] ligase [Winogradskyella sp.]